MLLFSLHMEPEGLQPFSCSDVEKSSPGLAMSAFGLILEASICLDIVTSSLQSNPTALLFSSPWISWRTAFPAGFKGTPGREAPQSMKGTSPATQTPQKDYKSKS